MRLLHLASHSLNASQKFIYDRRFVVYSLLVLLLAQLALNKTKILLSVAVCVADVMSVFASGKQSFAKR